MKHKYFSLEKHKQTATLTIYGDIWCEGDVSAVNLSNQLDAMGDVDQIDVYINSYGGEVAEGLAIYNALKRHKASVTTYCDGFACSIASVIFMAGDVRIMNESSLLMIHNAWTMAAGNAEELRKQADDLEKITQASVEAYKANSNLSEEEIKALMDDETWLLPEEALEYGFATAIGASERQAASQNAFMKLFEIIKAYQAEGDETDDEPDENPEEPTPDDDGGADTDENPEPEEEPADEEEAADDDVEPDTGDEPTGDEPEDETPEDEDTSDDEEEPAQKWRGFFNAILHI